MSQALDFFGLAALPAVDFNKVIHMNVKTASKLREINHLAAFFQAQAKVAGA